jgi:hypothetical protein
MLRTDAYCYCCASSTSTHCDALRAAHFAARASPGGYRADAYTDEYAYPNTNKHPNADQHANTYTDEYPDAHTHDQAHCPTHTHDQAHCPTHSQANRDANSHPRD